MTATDTATATETSAQTSDIRRSVGWHVASFLGKYGTLVALALLVALFTYTSGKYFLTSGNIIQVFNQSALGVIIAGGLTIVLAAGMFDLSIGYHASLAGILVTWLMLQGLPFLLAIPVTIGIGLTLGAANGLLVTYLEVNALIATLGTGTAMVGLNYLVSGGMPQIISGNSFINISIGKWFGIPHPVYFMVLVAALLWILLNKTNLGFGIRAVGGNEEAAKLSGVRVNGVKVAAFAVAGACAAITGILFASSVGSGQPTGGDNYTLTSFGAAFLGAAVLRRGEFHIVGTFVGVVTVAVGFNGLALLGVASYVQYLFQGGLLVVAVALSSVGRRLSSS